MKAHSGIIGNEKADMLAQLGQHNVCKSGRYSVLSQKNSPTNCLHNSSKNFDGMSKLSLNDNSKNLEVTHIVPDTPSRDQFPVRAVSSPSPLQQVNSSSPSSPSRFSISSSPTLHPFGLSDY